jgi:hypothetical protein
MFPLAEPILEDTFQPDQWSIESNITLCAE